MKKVHLVIAISLIAAAFLSSSIAYSYLPERIPIHWNIHGHVDGYGARWTVFLLPGTMILMLALSFALPWLSPKQFEIEPFKSTYSFVMLATVALFGYLHAVILWSQLSSHVDISRALFGGIFLFLAALGNVLGRVRRNFWIGVRTPWTLANERVWNDTHRLAARLFVAAGVVGFVITLAGMPIVVSLILMVAAALVPVAYSLIEYKQLERRGEV